MTTTRRTENFPVASWLLPRRLRPPIHAFYAFVRTADDIADNPDISCDNKLLYINEMLVKVNQIDKGKAQAQNLLSAFRQDVTKTRYADWNELMAYCRLSAAPVGRFLIELTGGDEAAWPPSDALCAALQIINHVQDCGEDFRTLDRVYLPADMLAREGATVDALAASQASSALRRVLDSVLDGVDGLLDEASSVGSVISDRRLAREASGIYALARRLVDRLRVEDPLAGPVRLSRPLALWTFICGALMCPRAA